MGRVRNSPETVAAIKALFAAKGFDGIMEMMHALAVQNGATQDLETFKRETRTLGDALGIDTRQGPSGK